MPAKIYVPEISVNEMYSYAGRAFCARVGRMRKVREPEWLRQVGARLRLTRMALGIRQVDIARKFDCSTASWNHYETGKRPLDIDLAVQLCDEYGLTLDWLYRGDNSGLKKGLVDRIENKLPVL
jgi:DNA-binding XRE family transcriptional regulator